MATTVRPIAPPDVPRVWQLLTELAQYEKLTDILTGTPEMFRQALFGGGDRLLGLVAQRDEAGADLVGYAIFYPVYGSFRARWRLHLEDIYVTPDARGTGAGLALFRALARHARDHGYIAIDWEVLDWNRLALDFYDRLGGARTGEGWYRYRLDGPALERLGGGEPGR